MSELRSIMTDDLTRCWWCGSTRAVQMHHIFGGSSRKCSDEDGLIIPLCMEHHTGQHGIHFNSEMMDEVHKEGQRRWMSHYRKSTSDFRARYRKNYLEEDDEDI